MPALLAFFQLLPKILTMAPEVIALVNRLLDSFNKLHETIGNQNLSAWVSDLEKTTDNLKNATTTEQKIAAAKSYADLIRRL